MKREIQNRTDVSLLVHAFYDKIRANEEIGPFLMKPFTIGIVTWKS